MCGYRSVRTDVLVCYFVILLFCTVTDFSGQGKASGVKFWRLVQGVLDRESPILGNFAFPEALNRTNRRAAASIADRRQSRPLTVRLPSVEGTGVYRQ